MSSDSFYSLLPHVSHVLFYGGKPMKLNDQFSTMNKMVNSVQIINRLIDLAGHDSEMLADLNSVKETVLTAKNFNLLANSLFDGIHIVDADSIVVYINKSFTKVSGFTDEIVGKHIDALEKLGYNAQIAKMALQTKETVNVTHSSAITKVNMTTTATPVIDDDGFLLGILIIDRDITELQRLQAELKKSEKHILTMKEDLISRQRALAGLMLSDHEQLLIGTSDASKSVDALIHQVAPLEATVLITGETGSGKENVASEIHKNSNRKGKPFIKINCSAIPANLIESELFGYEKGSFTGANAMGKAGLFELAQSGTILLDEIGELPLEVQPKLLRVIQQKELLRIGATKPISLDVRIIAATNRNLEQMCAAGTFRPDLYYRLNIFPIQMPPLRARGEDIPLLVTYFLSAYNAKYDKSVTIDSTALTVLQNYSWPGNIRELQNIIERLVIISPNTIVISSELIQSTLGILPDEFHGTGGNPTLQDKVEALEKRELTIALTSGKSTREIGKILGIDASNVVRKMKKYGITRDI